MPRWQQFENFLTEARRAPTDAARQQLVNELLREHPFFPWVEEDSATFAYIGTGAEVERVALNMDVFPHDPPFEPLTKLEGTNFWYVTRKFNRADLLDYLFAINDPMTPIASERHLVARVTRYWRADPLNPQRMESDGQLVSVLRMPDARPFPNWAGLRRVTRGTLRELTVSSEELNFADRRVTVYLPPGYDESQSDYPLLILHDGKWMANPLQVPAIADALIKHQELEPTIIAMIDSGSGEDRDHEYTSMSYSSFLVGELLPLLQTNFRISGARIGIGGVALGAVAAANASLQHPTVFSRLILISPPLGKGAYQEMLSDIRAGFERADQLPVRVFQSVGKYEGKARFVRAAEAVHEVLDHRRDVEYKFVETHTGHSLVAFRGILPEALAWVFPGAAG